MSGGHDDSLAFRDLVRDVLAEECGSARLRADLEGRSEPRARWNVLAGLDLFAATVGEEFGGLGLDESVAALIAEEVGYACLPEPVVETMCVVVPVISRYGTPEIKQRWLPAIAAGDVIATVQLDGAAAASFGEFADLAIVGGSRGLRIVELSDDDRRVMISEDFARRPAAIVSSGASLTDDPNALDDATARGSASAAAVLNGVSRRLLDMSVAYALDREQFGVPVGSFQAIKHMLAEVYVEVESARPAAWFAARALGRGDDDAGIHASAAKLVANRAGALASWQALQVHGGIGYTWEHDLHLWMKREKALEQQWGSTRDLSRQLGRVMLGHDDLMAAFGPRLAEQS